MANNDHAKNVEYTLFRPEKALQEIFTSNNALSLNAETFCSQKVMSLSTVYEKIRGKDIYFFGTKIACKHYALESYAKHVCFGRYEHKHGGNFDIAIYCYPIDSNDVDKFLPVLASGKLKDIYVLPPSPKDE